MALVTRDPVLYADLAGSLRERRIATVSLFPGDRIPERVAAVLTSAAEAPSISHSCVLAVGEGLDRSILWAAVEQALSGDGRVAAGELVVGIDPGPRPGYAVVAGGRPLVDGVLEGPEAIGPWAAALAHRFPGRSIRYRVGSGDPPARDRLVRILSADGRRWEFVDERSTTPRIARRLRDAAAARAIARTSGATPSDVAPVRSTLGALRRIQHLSREGSGGKFSISRARARQVLAGELTLPEAIAAEAPRMVGPPRPRRSRRTLISDPGSPGRGTR